ncbi:lysophospholipid acyltransferase family protein [Henriciella sp. AS95]|uniref:lysophospholipid acyltransferase family protein n=1 Tax=Henriciella sp. AS95 TaxID=3135782 RepID=UPI0031713C79
MIWQLIRRFILVFIAKPYAMLIIGLDVRGRANLPTRGPAIIAANHNSHIDTLLLLSLFPSKTLKQVRPVAAADHFLKTRLSSWFSRNVIGIIPVNRQGAKEGEDVLAGCKAALANNEILVIFPEGSRGEAEEMGAFKSGIARLAEAFPQAPIVPAYIQGAGRVLPRGSKIIVPFNCSAILGAPFTWCGKKDAFMERLRATIETLRADAPPLRWL